jgi:hypothetical protein
MIVFRDNGVPGGESAALVLRNGSFRIPSRVCITAAELLFGSDTKADAQWSIYGSLKMLVAVEVSGNPKYYMRIRARVVAEYGNIRPFLLLVLTHLYRPFDLDPLHWIPESVLNPDKKQLAHCFFRLGAQPPLPLCAPNLNLPFLGASQLELPPFTATEKREAVLDVNITEYFIKKLVDIIGFWIS